MSILEIYQKDKKLWDDFLSKDKNGSFLQSFAWGELEKAEGKKIWRLGIFDHQQKIIGAVLLVKNYCYWLNTMSFSSWMDASPEY